MAILSFIVDHFIAFGAGTIFGILIMCVFSLGRDDGPQPIDLDRDQ